MSGYDWRPAAARDSLRRLLPLLEKTYKNDIVTLDPILWTRFKNRIHRKWERLFTYLHELYGWQYDFYYTLERVIDLMIQYWLKRPGDLHELDDQRENDPLWYLSEQMVGIVLYVDLFSDNLKGLFEHLPYFEKLGVTYIHLMPIFAVPYGENDGGYAVSDYRAINPDIGTMEELALLAKTLRQRGISLVLDFVFNHTSDEHRWARKAKSGDMDYMNYYFTFSDRNLVDRFQAHLRDIFPNTRKGCFTWNHHIERWVWTTFNSYQWDLNYANPSVFLDMAGDMLFLANQGVEVLRLDAVAFIWKRLGTRCENLQETHTIIRAYNAIARIAAPSLVFKSEAIVEPDEVIKYAHTDECQLSYNPLLMALLWEAIATRQTRLLNYAMRHREMLPHGCTWVNYLRCHDDIGWTFDDNDAKKLGIDPRGHRKFLIDFYTGNHEGSFARGMPFQFDPETGDSRISGTLSSLAGLEDAIEKKDGALIDLAVRRINMLRSIQVSIGGIPLLYAGDEIGMLNDYTFLSDPKKANDTRWVHRRKSKGTPSEAYTDLENLEMRFFHEMIQLFTMRKQMPVLRNGGMEVIDTGNNHLFGFLRANKEERLLVINNFSEALQIMPGRFLTAAGIHDKAYEIFTEQIIVAGEDLRLEGYRYMWLKFSV